MVVLLYGGIGAGLEMLSRQLAGEDMSHTLLNGAGELLAAGALNPFHHLFHPTVGPNPEANALQGHSKTNRGGLMLAKFLRSQRNSGDEAVFHQSLQLGQDVTIPQLLQG